MGPCGNRAVLHGSGRCELHKRSHTDEFTGTGRLETSLLALANTSADFTGSMDDFTVSGAYLDRIEEIVTWS